MISLIDYANGFLTFSYRGCAYQLDITEDMCSLSLGEEVPIWSDFSYLGGSPEIEVNNTTWVYPKPDELSFDEAATLAKEHFKLGRLLTYEELEVLAVDNPAYHFYLAHYTK